MSGNAGGVPTDLRGGGVRTDMFGGGVVYGLDAGAAAKACAAGGAAAAIPPTAAAPAEPADPLDDDDLDNLLDEAVNETDFSKQEAVVKVFPEVGRSVVGRVGTAPHSQRALAGSTREPQRGIHLRSEPPWWPGRMWHRYPPPSFAVDTHAFDL